MTDAQKGILGAYFFLDWSWDWTVCYVPKTRMSTVVTAKGHMISMYKYFLWF